MDKKINIKSSTYQKIALDIASRIAENKLRVGDKIYARTSIASQYNVSSETARRAINVLSDLEIVESLKGSGVTIKSYENAVKYVRNFSEKQTVKALITEMQDSFDKQKNEINNLQNLFYKLLDNTQRFQSINPFVPYEIKITNDAIHLNKLASEVNFWQNTNATIIAINRGDITILSPGPYSVFRENDILYFVGDENSYIRVKDFMYGYKE
ncbi:MAG: GntR family transcriptional regulator [Sedimentibacter sp.]|uniref:GntR family transcriptional regulator n=1 Tax=Sedimentibacter sp. TaxID=1960295 RepID=UPI00298175C8|nr:GntR family transcriptional regulator [Sedimentibacter sp.]MDW5299795.1 GntR family transcriptional regulator [Sedimentibacter sp.]